MTPGRPLDRPDLLRTGAAVLQARMPAWNVAFRLVGIAYRARWDWPGVVTVADDNTGEVLARSIPGKPTEPDAETLARARGMRGPAA